MEMATLDEVSLLIRDAIGEMGIQFGNRLNEMNNAIQQLQPPSVEIHHPVAILPNVNNNNTSLDLIKSLPEFKGDATEYPPWREAAHFAINYYINGSENYYIAMGILRNKITGAANVALSSFNTVLNFKAIIERLDQCYSDKRPIHVLESELSVLRQNNLSIQDFYDCVDKQLTLIVNKIKMNNNNEQIVCALNDRARENALRVFITGLRRPLCDILFSSKPQDLPSALATAQELEFNQKRQDFARAFSNNKKQDPQQVPYFQNSNNSIRSYNPRNFTRSENNTLNPTPGPKNSFETPVSMDVDPGSSILRKFSSQSNNRKEQHDQANSKNTLNPNQEHMKSLRHTPFAQHKFQTLNHLPTESDNYFKTGNNAFESDH